MVGTGFRKSTCMGIARLVPGEGSRMIPGTLCPQPGSPHGSPGQARAVLGSAEAKAPQLRTWEGGGSGVR